MKLANGKKSKLLEYLMIIVGTGLMSLAINSVFDASGMVTGGFSGVAIIVKSCKQEVITGKIPYRLKGQPCRQRNFSYQCFLYKRETMYLPSDQKQWNIQSNIGYPKRDSTVNDSFCPGLYDNRYTGKTAGNHS